jgi:hypothetical protein
MLGASAGQVDGRALEVRELAVLDGGGDVAREREAPGRARPSVRFTARWRDSPCRR